MRKWVSVKNRLPEIGALVYIYNPAWAGHNSNGVYEAWLARDDIFWTRTNTLHGTVTHWMPERLPSPPFLKNF